MCAFFFLLALAGGCYCVSLSIMKYLVLVLFIFCFELAAVGQGEPAHLAPERLCWVDSKDFAERDCSFLYEPGVRVKINAPAEGLMTPRKPVRLVFYALPNGNSTEWTFGKRMEEGDDWHFDIQHIGAQTRFLRAVDTLHSYVVVYLEAENRSWGAWRKAGPGRDHIIKELVEQIALLFSAGCSGEGCSGAGCSSASCSSASRAGAGCSGADCANQSMPQVELSSHSGGGNFIFGFMDACDSLPDYLCRISFIDSDYNWDDERYGPKLVRWLSGGAAATQHNTSCVGPHNAAVPATAAATHHTAAVPATDAATHHTAAVTATDAGTQHIGARPATQRQLFVACYKDYVALYNGKPFVSKKGGTWHRTKMMYNYLRRHLEGAQWSRGGGERAGQRGGQCEPRAGQGAKQCIVRRTWPCGEKREEKCNWQHCGQSNVTRTGQCYFYWKKNREKKIYHTLLVELNGFIHSELVGTPLEGDSYLFMGPRAYDSPNFLR